MKFGKRLETEAERRWLQYYIDYKSVKKSIKRDIECGDLESSEFQKTLVAELHKVGVFYQAQEGFLQFTLDTFLDKLANHMNRKKSSDISIRGEMVNLYHDVKGDVRDLHKFVLLNYVAVVKAVKKRNRHMVAMAMDERQVQRMKPIQFLASEYFFTSLKLAAMKTRLDVVEREVPGLVDQQPKSVDEEYSCPICLNVLKGPVALSCSHVFCWGCLVALCSAVRRQANHEFAGNGEKEVALWDCSDDEMSTAATFNCPCCRKEQLLDLDRLVVDSYLEKYLVEMEQREGEQPPKVEVRRKDVSYLLPPQRPEYKNKLTLCLDLDGTLVTTFTPKRAPRLPDCAVSYVVGEGGKLNPGGIFVVERPGLGDFLRRAACLCEVVLFTAGLEDYAAPILDEIERRYGKVFAYRLYRPATSHSEVYPCVKDMSKLGRDINKCILVDDTPLAFYRQPDHGIPVLQFRGDIDDRLLPEAVEPLIFTLIKEKNVPLALRRRFNMMHWFQSQGLDPSAEMAEAKASAKSLHRSASTVMIPSKEADHQEELITRVLPTETVIVMDFDKTITDWDAGERLTDEISPELTSLLSSVESLANFIPMTNTVLSEMHRRGVSRDRIVNVLRGMGAEVPKGSISFLRYAISCGMDCKVLSDCNEMFIGHVLSSAKIKACFSEIVTNYASFERVEHADSASMHLSHSTSSSWFFGETISPPEQVHQKLVISPRHDYKAQGHHGCTLCPENLCKGRELHKMISNRGKKTRRVVYIGDGANDYCPVRTLGRNDIVLARKGYPLENLIQSGKEKIHARVVFWESHDELLPKLQAHTRH